MRLYVVNLTRRNVHGIRTLVIDSDEARRRENGNQDSILCRDDDEFLIVLRRAIP